MTTDDPDDGWFGESVAARYDSSDDDEFDPRTIARTVGVLAELAGDGPALELAVGTGRLAAPLAARGVPVCGIELSRAMARRIAGKPGADGVQVTIGDMTTVRVPGEFSLAYLAFNTIGNLTTQDAQVACFVNAAVHLRPGGCFLVEVGVPDLRRLPPGQDTVPFRVETGAGGGYVGFDRYDVATQRLESVHVTVDDGVGRVLRVPFRYAWPTELDLMARIAGLRLRDRWSGWDRSPFTAESTSHVSVWEKPLDV
ncbi:class I SAM-dependent DNA methyltransferase [Isoptericola croceus]|uniref:class I SAM-dependent DNA methyltransferase n=1 Tax=Isoptericola croceus TaxID=3031406 RepID=UPI0023F87F36|nr:class I SAM-dependent methyltransferase [Isoptericola croceus]